MPQEASPHVVAVLGSPRRSGNCAALLRAALAELESKGAAVETIHLSAHDVRYCAGHDDCAARERCAIRDDAPELLDRVYEADVVVLASPVYADNISGQMKVFLDRGCHDYSRGRRLKARVIGLVTVADSTGLDDALAAMTRALAFISREGVPTFSVKGFATLKGDAEKDCDLMEAAHTLGRSLADSARLST
jgi:multimeric flavodoxin WrbA